MKDVVAAYLTLAESMDDHSLAGEAFNFSRGSPVSVMEMTNKILEVMNKKDYPVHVLNEAKGEIKDQYLTIEKAMRLLNWTPHYCLEDGLKETIEWYRNFFNV
jgi:CDP-glucose 4,6-dehydratase